MELTVEKLKELLRYEPETGLFYWKVAVSQRVKAGDIAGTLTNEGYLRITIKRKNYQAHRLAWLYTYNKWPESVIDHINTVKTDNRIVNLRDVTKGWNNQHRIVAHKNNKTKLLGVHPKGSKFATHIRIDGKTKHLGHYKTPEEAHNAYIEAKIKYHPGYLP